jgi:hypothetical protein
MNRYRTILINILKIFISFASNEDHSNEEIKNLLSKVIDQLTELKGKL